MEKKPIEVECVIDVKMTAILPMYCDECRAAIIAFAAKKPE